MLSRVADSIYWLNRYIERAENVARFIDVLGLQNCPQTRRINLLRSTNELINICISHISSPAIRSGLRQQLFDDLPADLAELLEPAAVEVGELAVVQPEQV